MGHVAGQETSACRLTSVRSGVPSRTSTLGELRLDDCRSPVPLPELLIVIVSRCGGLTAISPPEESPEHECPCLPVLDLGGGDMLEKLSVILSGVGGLWNVRELTAPAISFLGCRVEDCLGRIPIPASHPASAIGPAMLHPATSTWRRPPARGLSSTRYTLRELVPNAAPIPSSSMNWRFPLP